MDMPVTPPSMNRLDIKKPFNPSPAERIPSIIRVVCSRYLRKLFIKFYDAFGRKQESTSS